MVVPKTQHLIMEVARSQAATALHALSRMVLHPTSYTTSASVQLAAMPAAGALHAFVTSVEHSFYPHAVRQISQRAARGHACGGRTTRPRG